MSALPQNFWPSARHYAEAIQFPAFCFSVQELRAAQPAVDRLGMPLVTSGQFAYVYKLKTNNGGAFGVRCFRGYLGDREERYMAINSHLAKHKIPALTSFDYEPEGILVGGKRYPVLIMEWVDGPTLDVYLDEVVHKSDVVRHIADQWLNLISSLRESNISHGDLQHGNIIIERGTLRLVDLDGMFVPAMRGWEASEVGHQHYQHPKRDQKFFNEELDNFSALVIYLSLISLAERPQLWKRYHDENLLFTKADFHAPENSALLKEIKEIGPQHRRLAEELEDSARHRPFATPSLLELVEVKPELKLPLWMTAPPEVDVAARTREDKTIVIQRPQHEIPNWTPWQERGSSSTHAPNQSDTIQTIFAAQNIAALVKPTDPKDLLGNTFFYANQLVNNKTDFSVVAFATVLWFASMCVSPWAFFFVPILAVTGLLGVGFFKAYEDYQTMSLVQPANSSPGLYAQQTFQSLMLRQIWLHLTGKAFVIPIIALGCLSLLGALEGGILGLLAVGALSSFPIAVIFSVCLHSSYRKACLEYERQQKALQSGYAHNLSGINNQTRAFPLYSTQAGPVANYLSFTNSIHSQSALGSFAVIGNAMFGVYHKPDCVWVDKIPPGKRHKFASIEEAEDENYNPCHICFGDNETATSNANSQPNATTQTQISVIKTFTNNQSLKPDPVPTVQIEQQTQTSGVMFIGNRMLGIYHKPDCEWGEKIPNGKRINFYTEKEAEHSKYRHCHICLP